jgi:hypothetical protein
MFQAFLIKFVANAVFDAVVESAEKAVVKSSNPVDDKFVETLKASKTDIIGLLKK